ncbi:MAG: choice-of-anchor J domain-containing protein [Muribaculaceae bacterium]|nr:choice-of-anchor J domain-containing protein [Muribaculaceae bacterium]
MRKCYSLLIGSVLAMTGIAGANAQTAKTVPYSSPIAISTGVDDGWTAIQSDNGNWNFTSTSANTTDIGGSGFMAESRGNTKAAKDEWLISPLIHFDADKEYRLFYYYKAESNTHPQDMNMYITPSDDPATIKRSTPNDAVTGFIQTTWTKQDYTYKPTTTGDYHVALQCVSLSDNYYMRIAVLQVYENNFAPSGVTGLTASRDESTPREVKVNLSWTLPTESVFGETFSDTQTISKVNIYRDGGTTPIKTFNEAATTFEDNADNGLTAGIHTYEVEVEVAGALSPKVSVTTKYVGPVTPEAVPYTWTITDQDAFEDWKSLVADEAVNTSNWTYYSLGTYARFSNTANQKEANYLIAPPFNITKEGYYLVTVNAMIGNTSYNPDNILKVVYGNECSIASMQTVCDKINFTSSSKAPYSYVVKISTPGTYYFGVEAASETPKATTFGVYSIGLEETEKTPNVVTDLTATPGENDALTVNLTWTCPTQSSNGETLANSEYSIEVYRGADKIATLNGGISSYKDEAIEQPGVYNYSVKTVAPQGASVGPVEISSPWVGPHIVALPYSTQFKPADTTVAVWDIVDANKDGKSWVYYSNSYRCAPSEEAGEGDRLYKFEDYFLTPHFDIPAGYYKLQFKVMGGNASNPVEFKVGAVKAGTFNAENPVLLQEESFTSTSLGASAFQTYLFKAETADKYQIVFGLDGFYFVSNISSDEYYFPGISDFSIEAFPVLPEVATELTAEVADNEELEVTLTWINPSVTNVEDMDLEIAKAVIIRDGEEVAEVTENLPLGEQSTFVDTEDTGLTAGPHTYSVEIYNFAGKSTEEAPTVKVSWVGGGLEAPVRHSVEHFENLWTFIDADNNKNSSWDCWSIGTTAMKVDQSNEDGSFDDWAVSPKLKVESGVTYTLTFESYLGALFAQYAPYTLDVYVLNGSTDQAIKIGEIVSKDETADATTDPETTTITIFGDEGLMFDDPVVSTRANDDANGGADEQFAAVPAQTLNIALHSHSKGGVYVKTFKMEEYDDSLSIIESLEHENEFATDGEVEYYNLQGMKVKNPDKGIFIKVEGDKVTKIAR